jgi:hypothetical protein
MCYSMKANIDQMRLKRGFEILKELHRLSVAFVENNCFLIPSKSNLCDVSDLYQKLESVDVTENSIERDLIYSIDDSSSGEFLSREVRFDRYNKFLLNQGMNSKDLLKMVFKISDDFDFESVGGNIVIGGKCEFLRKYGNFISKKLTKMNSRFEKDLKKAEQKRGLLISESKKIFITKDRMNAVNYAKRLINDVKKEQFII